MTSYQTPSVREAILNALKVESDLPPLIVEDIVFHMTDWIGDLEAFVGFCERPTEYSSKATCEILSNFLVHVPNHIAAAAKLLIGRPVEDIFDVGSVKCPRTKH